MEAAGGAIAALFGLIIIVAGVVLLVRLYRQAPLRGPRPLPPDQPIDQPAPTAPPRRFTTANLQLPGRKPTTQLNSERDRLQRLYNLHERLNPTPPAGEFIDPIEVTHGSPRGGEEGEQGEGGGEVMHWQRVPNGSLPATLAPPSGVEVEVFADGNAPPPDVQRRGGRPPRDSSYWRQAQTVFAPAQGRPLLLPVLFGMATLLLVVALVWLLAGGQARSAALPPGTAVLLVADFGEGATFRDSDAGKSAAEALRKDVQARVAGNNRLIVRARGKVSGAAQAADELRRQNAGAILWGTLPDGAGGAISATLTMRTVPPGEPWLRYGDPGRLIMPQNVALPNQPAAAGPTLGPLLASVLNYYAGRYEDARVAAEAVPNDAPPETLNMAGFLRAGALLASGKSGDARAFYEALEGRGWVNPALYNNWGVALALDGEYERAESLLNRSLELPAPPAPDLALLHANRAYFAQLLGNRELAKSEYGEVLKLKDAGDAAPRFAQQQLGYMLYQEGDTVGARQHTEAALDLAPDDGYSQRNLGLILLMERQPVEAQAQFKTALGTLTGWRDDLLAQSTAAESLGDTAQALRAAELVRALKDELGTTQYYIGMALADQAADAPPESFVNGIIRRIQGKQSLAEQAISAFEDAIRLDRDREDIRYSMGLMYRKMGDDQKAAEQFALAKQLDPRAAGSYEQLAAMYAEDKRLDKAATEYATLLQQNPGYLKGYIELAETYTAGNNPAAAADTYRQALNIAPSGGRDYYYRAQAAYALATASTPPDANLFNSAAAEAQTAFTLDASVWEAHLLLGEMYLLVGQSDNALAQYQLVLEREPDNADALYSTGKLLAASGQRDQALKTWTHLVELKPYHPQVHRDLAELYASADPPNLDRAIAEIKEAISIDGSKADNYLRLGDFYAAQTEWSDAANAYQDALKRNLDLVEAWQGLAHAQLRQIGKANDALKTARSFQQHAPGDWRAYLLLGEVYIANRNGAAAISQYEQALSLAPGNADALYGLGCGYALRGDMAQAEQYYRNALGADPNYVAALVGLGDLYFDAGRYSDAGTAYTGALGIDQRNAPAYAGWGRVLDRTAVRPEDYEEARKKLQHAADLDPTYAEPHNYLGDMYSARNMWSDAISEYSKAAKLKPEWALPPYRLGLIYLSQQKFPEAASAFGKATQNDGNLIEAWFGLAQAERAQGKSADAITHYRKAISLNANYASAWLYLGYTLEEDGQRTDAVQAFTRARDTAQDDLNVRSAAEEALRKYQ